ncbi:DNase I-like protein [Fomitiporia mediterranea MF3/22]|uniref:DNase I-like protein n=1 Tax=Fomitiporia mediterranea (strain MF3/22) TaxID=694068 RepID=UPI0004407373|nr:DNase I-like protein [Fomitiporia mediterranea MF3/22]EJD03828.1 DNase I-like protein [Fomitiporia mediterranea MF3/22]
MSSSSIRVLTFNCWGLKYVAKKRVERIRAIASALAQSDHDIIALQELWVYSDFEHVRASVEKRLPYAKFFYSGALGAGLAIFSCFPILTASIYPYSLNGHPVDVGAGDWMVGKAAASVLIQHPVLGEVEVFNTHLFAKGAEMAPEHIRAHRLVNAWEFAKLARNSASLGRYVIALGDFNGIPQSLPMKIVRDHAELTDAWLQSHAAPTEVSTSGLTPKTAIERFGITADSPLNSYSAGKDLEPFVKKTFGKRLDYVFFRQPVERYMSERPTLKCSHSQVVFTDRVPDRTFSFSDHFGLEATIDIVAPYESEPTARTPRSSRLSPLTDEIIATFIQALTVYYRLTQSRSRIELTIFATSVVVLIGLCVSSPWFTASWITPILVLVTILLAWLGTTMLYAGFIYGNWERRALMNVIEELELIKRANSGRLSPSTSLS